MFVCGGESDSFAQLPGQDKYFEMVAVSMRGLPVVEQGDSGHSSFPFKRQKCLAPVTHKMSFESFNRFMNHHW